MNTVTTIIVTTTNNEKTPTKAEHLRLKWGIQGPIMVRIALFSQVDL